jgi:hypothetical protein
MLRNELEDKVTGTVMFASLAVLDTAREPSADNVGKEADLGSGNEDVVPDPGTARSMADSDTACVVDRHWGEDTEEAIDEGQDGKRVGMAEGAAADVVGPVSL